MRDVELIAWLAARARDAPAASVRTGAFLRAAAGLLDGKRVATHWHWCVPGTQFKVGDVTQTCGCGKIRR